METYIHRDESGANSHAPVLFLFHGTGGDETQLLGLGRTLMPGARLVAPRGDVEEAGMARFFRRTGEGVYDMEDLGLRTGRMAAFVRQAISGASPSAVIGLGYSNGANILASVLMAHPGLFTAAALLHPLIPFEPRPSQGLTGTDVLITAGRRDPICPPHLTERLATWFEVNKARVRLVWHEGGHELRETEITALEEFVSAFR